MDPVGMEADASKRLDSPGGNEVGGSGLLARMRDFAPYNQFFLDGAKVQGELIVLYGRLSEATGAKPLTDVPGRVVYALQ